MDYVLIGILYFILSVSYIIMFPSKRIIPRKLTYLIIGLTYAIIGVLYVTNGQIKKLISKNEKSKYPIY